MSYQIEITRKQEITSQEHPSTLCNGEDDNSSEFIITGNCMPTKAEVNSYLSEGIVNFCMQTYDSDTGIGTFVVVDGWVPEVGTLYIFDDI